MKCNRCKQPLVSREKKSAIMCYFVNSILAGSFVFLGAIADGVIGQAELMAAFGVSGIVALTKFREYWITQEPNKQRLFQFQS